MKKALKKVVVCTLAAALTLSAVPAKAVEQSPDDDGTQSDAPVAETNSDVTAKKQNGITVVVDTKANGTATLGTVKKTNKKSVTVAKTVTVDGVEYKVTTIDANAFKNAKKMTKVTLPATIKKINKNAFAGAKKLKTITLKITKNITVKKGAFKGLNTKKMTIKVSKKMSKKQLKKFKKTLKKAGFNGKVKKA